MERTIDSGDAQNAKQNTGSPFKNWGARLGSGMGKRIPKIKVCHKSKEFAVLTALMN
jgi:hypothetical protein